MNGMWDLAAWKRKWQRIQKNCIVNPGRAIWAWQDCGMFVTVQWQGNCICWVLWIIKIASFALSFRLLCVTLFVCAGRQTLRAFWSCKSCSFGGHNFYFVCLYIYVCKLGIFDYFSCMENYIQNPIHSRRFSYLILGILVSALHD